LQETLNIPPLIDLYCSSFKRGIFDFITITPKGKHEKQAEALAILTDNETEEFLYGGAAGGAKSWTGCSWLAFMCKNFPGTKWFIGREELKRITESTLITFYKVCAAYGLKSGVDFKFNAQKNFIQFANGSRIDLLELVYKPSDPLYERFGSTEYTGGWIEEAGEIHFGAYDVLKTRIGRHFNDKYGILAKLFLTCNPKKNWLYTTFYQPYIKNTLTSLQKYLVALVQDNPHIESGYIDRLKRIKDKATKERLLKGNWEYDDDPTALCAYDDIIAIFENTHVQPTGKKFITCDAARFGSDKARVCVWDEWVLLEHHEYAISATTDIQDCINAMRVKHSIPAKRAICDQDGLGGGIVDNCKILGFTNNAAPLVPKESTDNRLNDEKKENYANLQAQCIYGLASKINNHEFYIACDLSPADKEEISTELSWMKTYKSDDERKLRVLPKEIVKQNIGHSPDWRDVFMMRCYFDIEPEYQAAKSRLPAQQKQEYNPYNDIINDMLK
jgi:phage terminase large subunit